jgi:hypothetical protein
MTCVKGHDMCQYRTAHMKHLGEVVPTLPRLARDFHDISVLRHACHAAT